jgi:hypothetical protein
LRAVRDFTQLPVVGALRLQFDDRDEPIAEIAAPEALSGRDFLDTARR